MKVLKIIGVIIYLPIFSIVTAIAGFFLGLVTGAKSVLEWVK